MVQSVCVNVSGNRLFRALQELEAAGMLPSSQEEAARLANRIRIRGADDAITIVLPEVRLVARKKKNELSTFTLKGFV